MNRIDKIMGMFGAVALVAIVTVVGLSNFSNPKDAVTARTWTKQDSKAYANDALNEWAHKQYVCLASMWGKESAWKHTALNPEKVMGKHAGGIPQLLGMSPLTPPTVQIDRGLNYIYYRYGTPCEAWRFHKKNGWY